MSVYIYIYTYIGICIVYLYIILCIYAFSKEYVSFAESQATVRVTSRGSQVLNLHRLQVYTSKVRSMGP